MNNKKRDILFEMTSMGAMVKVTAFDVQTMTEIHIQMPSSATEAMCMQAARQRLEYVLRKKGVIT